MNRCVASLFFMLVLAACSTSGTEPSRVISTSFKPFLAQYHCIDWQGGKRCYYVVAPPQGKPHHLVVALHPAFTSVELAENISRFAQLAVPKGYLLVYPEGVDKQWNDGRVMTKVKTYQRNTDDVGFINEVTRSVQRQYGLNAARTSAVGMSNGGMMALRLACQSNDVGLVGTVVANLPKGLQAQCTAKPKPMLMVWGTADDVVEYEGGILSDMGFANEWGEVESAADTETFFLRRNGCAPTRLQVGTLANEAVDGTVAHLRQYENCGEAALRTITVDGMGHTWPGERSRAKAWLTMRGRVTKQFNAGHELLTFIEDNQREVVVR